jgi:hypothetical protein
VGARTKTDWLGREKLSAKMTGVSPEQVADAVEAARAAWDAGRLAFAYRPSALAGFEADGLTEALDGVLRVGWKLEAASIGMQTVGPNRQEALFVFTRPREDASRP